MVIPPDVDANFNEPETSGESPDLLIERPDGGSVTTLAVLEKAVMK